MSTGTLPLVTINIPTYKQEKYIKRAIESCLAQDYPNLEIIVSDDCSPDNTYSIATAFANDKVKVFRNPTNIGRVANYRKMLYEYATGDWAVNLDGDDFYISNTFISEAISLLQQNPSAVMYAAGACALNEATNKVIQSPIKTAKDITILKGTDYVLNFYKLGLIGQHFAIVYNRNKALQTDFYILDSLGADTDSICRLALKGDVIIHKKYIGVWTSHGGNASYTLSIDNVNKELAMLDHIAKAGRNYIPEPILSKWLKESKSLRFRHALYPALPGYKFSDALRLLFKNWAWEKQSVKELIKIFLRTFKK